MIILNKNKPAKKTSSTLITSALNHISVDYAFLVRLCYYL